MAEVTKAELARAKRRGEALARNGVATAVVYDEVRNRVVVTLDTGIEIAFDPRRAQGLETATAEDLRAVEIEGAGFGIYFRRLDADIYVPALLQGILGTKAWMAQQRGAARGKVTSVTKAGATLATGKRGSQRAAS